ncbi:MAG: hypothetical protein HC912_02085 [Saprospiraceae bacterium]|nr:hypothetical protein [Saprospiraceae bacterium]
MTYNILLLEPIPEQALALLAQHAKVLMAQTPFSGKLLQKNSLFMPL